VSFFDHGAYLPVMWPCGGILWPVCGRRGAQVVLWLVLWMAVGVLWVACALDLGQVVGPCEEYSALREQGPDAGLPLPVGLLGEP